ncbi:MAG TPA: M90 family metallopeptidase [Burkholderiales bacterium]|nr:M90 family metallopeptidase [Burkholderiales bacterium]
MGWLAAWRRRRVLARHRVDDALWHRVTGRLPFLRGLDAEQLRRLQQLALLFLAEKEFAPVRGLVLDDAMRLSIAVQACLPILELALDWYAGWTGIVVYPSDFKVKRSEMDQDGVLHEWHDELAGESWPGGPVVLSWDAIEGARNAEINVVIHEFAHKLDMANGVANGVPPLHAGMDRAAWCAAFASAYERFCDALERGRHTWLDPYAAEDPSEFFAVLSEAFFEQPHELRRRYADVYEQLRLFYRQDPAPRMSA